MLGGGFTPCPTPDKIIMGRVQLGHCRKFPKLENISLYSNRGCKSGFPGAWEGGENFMPDKKIQ
jgi:hypothetical protein